MCDFFLGCVDAAPGSDPRSYWTHKPVLLRCSLGLCPLLPAHASFILQYFLICRLPGTFFSTPKLGLFSPKILGGGQRSKKSYGSIKKTEKRERERERGESERSEREREEEEKIEREEREKEMREREREKERERERERPREREREREKGDIGERGGKQRDQSADRAARGGSRRINRRRSNREQKKSKEEQRRTKKKKKKKKKKKNQHKENAAARVGESETENKRKTQENKGFGKELGEKVGRDDLRHRTSSHSIH